MSILQNYIDNIIHNDMVVYIEDILQGYAENMQLVSA